MSQELKINVQALTPHPNPTFEFKVSLSKTGYTTPPILLPVASIPSAVALRVVK